MLWAESSIEDLELKTDALICQIRAAVCQLSEGREILSDTAVTAE